MVLLELRAHRAQALRALSCSFPLVESLSPASAEFEHLVGWCMGDTPPPPQAEGSVLVVSGDKDNRAGHSQDACEILCSSQGQGKQVWRPPDLEDSKQVYVVPWFLAVIVLSSSLCAPESILTVTPHTQVP